MLSIKNIKLLTLVIASTSSVQGSGIYPKSLIESISLNKNTISNLKQNHHFYRYTLEDDVLDRVQRGGENRDGNILAQESIKKVERRQKIISRTKMSLSAMIVIIALKQIYENRDKLPSREKIQNYTFKAATNVKEKGNIGIVYFILGLALFETFGISTCPIEISGGFVFGVRSGFFINIFGKLFGAMTAYIIGRKYLSERITSKFLMNDKDSITKKDDSITHVINLIKTYIAEEPISTALVLRYSFFPQLLKNLFLSVMEPINWKLFLFVTCIHVMPFTLLFTCLGYDAAQRLLNPDIKTNYILSAGVLLSSLYGIFGSTGIVAIWYHKKSQKFK